MDKTEWSEDDEQSSERTAGQGDKFAPHSYVPHMVYLGRCQVCHLEESSALHVAQLAEALSGPWQAIPVNDGSYVWHVVPKDDNPAIMLRINVLGAPAFAPAVARLVATTPRLLKALEDLLTGLEMNGIYLLGQDKAVAAVREARGLGGTDDNESKA